MNAPRTTVFGVAPYAKPKRGCQPLYFGSKNVFLTFGNGQDGLGTGPEPGGVENGIGIRKQAFVIAAASAEPGKAGVAGTGQSGFQPDTSSFL